MRGRCSTASRRRASPTDREQAFKELLIAEGSDWFWWYGDDHSSDHDLEFDELFRRHLRNVYQMLGQPIPEELFATNISTGHVPVSVVRAGGASAAPFWTAGRPATSNGCPPAASKPTRLPAP